DGVREVLELERFVDERVRADDDGDLAVRDPLLELRARDVRGLFLAHLAREFAAFAAGDEADRDRMVLEVRNESREMLLREDLGRAHVRDLQVAALTPLEDGFRPRDELAA